MRFAGLERAIYTDASPTGLAALAASILRSPESIGTEDGPAAVALARAEGFVRPVADCGLLR